MNATLKSLRVLGTSNREGTTESESCGSNLPAQSSAIGALSLTPTNQAAKIILLSLLAKYSND